MANKSPLHSQHLKRRKLTRAQVTIINTRKQVENRLEKQWKSSPPGFTIKQSPPQRIQYVRPAGDHTKMFRNSIANNEF